MECFSCDCVIYLASTVLLLRMLLRLHTILNALYVYLFYLFFSSPVFFFLDNSFYTPKYTVGKCCALLPLRLIEPDIGKGSLARRNRGTNSLVLRKYGARSEGCMCACGSVSV